MEYTQALKEKLNIPRKIVITTHHKPDADALGSSLGLAGYLIKRGHDVQVITPSDYPGFLHWMKGNDDVIIYDEENAKVMDVITSKVANADLIFCLDFSCLSRINGLGELVEKSNSEKVLIDHHQNPQDFAQYVFWDTGAAATAELVYDLLVDMGESDLIDTDIAEALYSGIMTDTGSFRHSNTTKHVHEVVGQLIGHGADINKVSRLIYDNNSPERMKFLGWALYENLTIVPDLETAYFSISAEDLTRFNSKTGDTEGIVNYALSIEGVKIAAMFTEREEGVKISFRSVTEIAVNEIAAEHFDGGGHKNAAGGKSDLSLEDTVDKFLTILREHKKEKLKTTY
ncbi:bifunctional oligoribonuclease/PAP phosphatase NrnA [Mangrovivirga sp. M17]|uniref:Bifunctional oligoribonuclease/PAP phosphatase NrnA n=1 Tax=Mangrovivirga halotolerans TaxID=2993936 RepID=A0ABT3RPR2_9BACT|nr:bifunctional oligoribonuclease/PAP phosphatase NrnA [Mangrovivirga halotolerans]MCX2743155.1 bifunctional oligoribonuclease/PAP phosphatase NrnA [Mangrovivirga halotolerans]